MLGLIASLLLCSSPVQPSVELGTWFPAAVGGRVSVELPYRLGASVTAGVMPSAYLDATQSVLVAAGAYDEMTAQLISAALKNSLLLRVQAGWRPFTNSGFYFQVGYGLAALGGGLTGSELITAVTGKMVSQEAQHIEVKASALVHQFTAELGWQWFLWQGLFVRASVGGFLSLASHTDLSAPSVNARVEAAVEPALVAGEQYLDTTITTYVHAPVIGLTIGYQLFH